MVGARVNPKPSQDPSEMRSKTDKGHSCCPSHVVAKDPHKVDVRRKPFPALVEIDVEECDDNGSSYMKHTVSFLAELSEIIVIPAFPGQVVKKSDKLIAVRDRAFFVQNDDSNVLFVVYAVVLVVSENAATIIHFVIDL